MRRSSVLLLVLPAEIVLIAVIAWAAVQMNSIGGLALVSPISRTSEIDVSRWVAVLKSNL